jgi:hypothetical protein
VNPVSDTPAGSTPSRHRFVSLDGIALGFAVASLLLYRTPYAGLPATVGGVLAMVSLFAGPRRVWVALLALGVGALAAFMSMASAAPPML